jgi:SAM-dependent methyltransferase
MQERYRNRKRYFDELAATTRRYILPFMAGHHPVSEGTEVLEVGCGEGGNLLPFAEAGCRATGIDIHPGKIEAAAELLADWPRVRVFCQDFLQTEPDRLYDLIVVHDVIEHITDKDAFLARLHLFLRPGGMMFFAFPAWQMPFGGHQQICRSPIASRLPFMHLLPGGLYRRILCGFGESDAVIDELLDIRRCRTSIERFRCLVARHGYRIVREQLWFINPHYEVKFGLHPRRLTPLIGKIPWIRNFFSTSCFYLITPSPSYSPAGSAPVPTGR